MVVGDLASFRTSMSTKAPELVVEDHYPTGGANVTVSVWLTQIERQNLIERIVARETLVHDREKTIKALELAADDSISPEKSVRFNESSLLEKFTWEVSLLE